MVPILIILGLVVLYEMSTRAGAGAGSGVSSYTMQQAGPSQSLQQNAQLKTMGADKAAQALGFIPVAGPAIAGAFKAIAGALLQASQKRAKEAVSENSAVAAAVPGWDAGVATIAKAYNNGQIDGDQAKQLLQTNMANYWSEVAPQIQPGRNGCSSGANCPGSKNPNSATSLETTAPSSYCSGSIGASCCVGCASLALSTANMNYAISQADAGAPTAATIQAVFKSKYGGVDRSRYTVTFTKPSAITTTANSFLQEIGL